MLHHSPPQLAAVVSKYGARMTLNWQDLFGKVSDFNIRVGESVGGIRVVKAYGTERREQAVFGKGVNRLFRNIASSITGVSATQSGGTVAVGLVGLLIVGPLAFIFAQAVARGVPAYFWALVGTADTRFSFLLTAAVAPLAVALPAQASTTRNEIVHTADDDGDGVYSIVLRDLETRSVRTVLAADATPETLYDDPRMPYTRALLSAIPGGGERKRIVLQGDLPSPLNPPSGCPFRTRCWLAEDVCAAERPALREVMPGHFAACHFADDPAYLARLPA